MSLTYARLNAVRASAESGSFAAAARSLGLRAATVSEQIRSLEQEFGARLFIRRADGLSPTPLCNDLCAVAARVARDMSNAESLLRREHSADGGRLSIGLGNVMAGMVAIGAFHRAFPGVALTVKTGSHETITRAVITRAVDLGVLPDIAPGGQFTVARLRENEVVAICAPDHPLAVQERVFCRDLMKHKLLFRSHGSSTQRVVDRMFAQTAFTPTPFMTLDTRDAIYEAVVNCLGVGFVWKHGTGRNDGVRVIELADLTLRHGEFLFALRDHQTSLVRAFFDAACAEAQ